MPGLCLEPGKAASLAPARSVGPLGRSGGRLDPGGGRGGGVSLAPRDPKQRSGKNFSEEQPWVPLARSHPSAGRSASTAQLELYLLAAADSMPRTVWRLLGANDHSTSSVQDIPQQGLFSLQRSSSRIDGRQRAQRWHGGALATPRSLKRRPPVIGRVCLNAHLGTWQVAWDWAQWRPSTYSAQPARWIEP